MTINNKQFIIMKDKIANIDFKSVLLPSGLWLSYQENLNVQIVRENLILQPYL